MLGVLVAPEAVAFTAALVLMLLIGIVEAFGLGASGFDFHVHVDDGGLLGWLGVGRVPFLVLLVAALASFGVIGLAGQQIALAYAGALLPGFIAVPAAVVAALPATALLGRGLGRIMPHDETTAVPLDALVGLTGRITIGRAAQGSPARARVVDPHGQPHHVLVEPDVAAAHFDEGDAVLLVRREGGLFRAITHEPARFSNWID